MTQINLTITKLSFLLKILFLGLIIFGCEDDEPSPNTKVIAIYPPNGAENVELGFQFDWGLQMNDQDLNDDYYTNYELLIGTHPDQMVVVDTNIFYRTYAESKALELNTKIYWQIRVKDHDKFIYDSDIFEFKTASSLKTLELPQKKLMVYTEAFIPQNKHSILVAPQFGAFNLIDGRSNTEIIIDGYASTNTPEAFNQVAIFCSELNAYGYDDWYLPAIVELDSIVSKFHLVDSYEHRFEYWSSTEAVYTGDPYYGVYLKSYYTTQDRPYLIVQRSASANNKMRCLCVREVE
ncbi:MAG: hypothetical protein CMO01_17260 [Thalassobius sp.]|nr:hypothetical protein [Thalassovita sp.]